MLVTGNAFEKSKYLGFRIFVQDNYKIQYQFYNILYSFMSQDIYLQYTDHHIDEVQYIGVQACDTCIVFCILSCTASGGVPYKQEQLLAAMSTEHPIHLFHSFSSQSYMGMEAQGLQPASVPKHDQLGTQLSWHAQSALPLLGEVHRLFEFFGEQLLASFVH